MFQVTTNTRICLSGKWFSRHLSPSKSQLTSSEGLVHEPLRRLVVSRGAKAVENVELRESVEGSLLSWWEPVEEEVLLRLEEWAGLKKLAGGGFGAEEVVDEVGCTWFLRPLPFPLGGGGVDLACSGEMLSAELRLGEVRGLTVRREGGGRSPLPRESFLGLFPRRLTLRSIGGAVLGRLRKTSSLSPSESELLDSEEYSQSTG